MGHLLREEGGGSGRSYALPVMLLSRLLLLPISVPCCRAGQCGAQMSVGRKGRVVEIRQGGGSEPESRGGGSHLKVYTFSSSSSHFLNFKITYHYQLQEDPCTM